MSFLESLAQAYLARERQRLGIPQEQRAQAASDLQQKLGGLQAQTMESKLTPDVLAAEAEQRTAATELAKAQAAFARGEGRQTVRSGSTPHYVTDKAGNVRSIEIGPEGVKIRDLGPIGQPQKEPDLSGKHDARLDKSYQFNSSQLESARKPLMEQADRFSRLIESVNQRTPQADALIAPELLTAMAGGQGSGLRMNEAEIARIVGGRSNVESLKAALNKWSLDPSQALSITDAQRAQIRDLIGAMHQRVSGKISAFNDAAQQLVDAPDVQSHRRILADLKKRVTAIETGADQANQVALPPNVEALLNSLPQVK